MFGLGVRRHRLFESNIDLHQPDCRHAEQDAASPGYPVKRYHSGRPIVTMSTVVGVYGRGQGLGKGEVDLWRRVMGTPWMSREGMREAIPPAYAEHIGRQLLAHIAERAA
jgi:DNA (cytosine-5)-methyltransferase 1